MKIHILSSSLRINSGFSIVARNIANGLKKLNHNVTMTGLQTSYIPEFAYGIENLPIQTHFIDDMTQYMMTLDRIKPDVVLNIFQADYEYNDFPKVFKKSIWYPPVEGRDIPQKMANDLLAVKMNGGEIVAQCKYGQGEIQLALGGIDIPFVYHGFNDKIFKPLKTQNIDGMRYCYYKTQNGRLNSDPMILHNNGCYDCQLNNTEQIKCQHYKEEYVSILKFINGKWTEESIPITKLPGITKGKYVFGFIGQNLGVRKRIERLLNAYYIFIKDSRQLKDRTILHLHTMPIAVNGINLIKIIQELGIYDNVIFSYGTYRSSAWTDESMNILYNTFDVNTSASSSEGFGLGTLESMACGIPNIGPDCSSFTELIGKDETKRGLLANIGEWQMIQDGCLLPDSPILTLNRGIQKIKDIKVGDKALTHKGRFMKVSQVMKREYSGDMIEITPHKLRIPIVLTPEHRVLAVKTENCSGPGWAICHPGRDCYYTDKRRLGKLYKICKYIRGEEPYTKYKTTWIDAKDLKVGDYVTYPRSKEKEIDINKIRILDYIDDFLNITGDNYCDNTQQTDLFGGFLEKKIKMYGKMVTNTKEIPVEIELTRELMRLFGYFIAEGNNSEYDIGFTFNINEIEYLEDVEKLVKNIFGLDCGHYIDEEKHSHQLIINSKILSNFFQNMFSPNEYKTKKEKGSKANIVRIPTEFLNLPLDKLAELIKGEYRGDGSFESSEYNIITSSETLANQLLYILSRFGILASIYKKNNKDGITFHVGIWGKDVEIFDNIICEKHEYGERIKSSQYLKGNNFYFVPIKNIDTIKYDGYVWNLQVEEDNTYVSTINVHNSYRALVSEEDLAHQMKSMYQDEDLRKRCSKNAIKFTNYYTWEKICLTWDSLLKNIK